MHWGITFSSFPAHECGKYAKSKFSPECNLPLPATVGCGNDTNHVCVNAYVTKSVHCLCFFAFLASPLSSDFLVYELVGSGQCSGMGVITHPLWHELFPRGDLKDAFDSSATTGALHFPSCTLSSVYRSSFNDSKTFRSFGGLDPKKRNRR
jgi:hypothetical protein